MNTPKTFLIGETAVNLNAVTRYLEHTDQVAFVNDYNDSKLPTPLRLVSFYAKLCYKSLVLGKNKNVSKIRSIEDNVKSIINSGHGSVLEHVYFNFVTTGCSRIFTHELVRHRAGTAFSQTSGRYCAMDDESSLVLDPILEPVGEEVRTMFSRTQTGMQAIYNRLGLNGFSACWLVYNGSLDNYATDHPRIVAFAEEKGFVDNSHKAGSWKNTYGMMDHCWQMPFSLKKKLTSACRRLSPSGLSNEIGWSANLRALRHMIEMRTSRHAEWEIRHVFNEVAELVGDAYLTGGSKEMVDGYYEWKGLRV